MSPFQPKGDAKAESNENTPLVNKGLQPTIDFRPAPKQNSSMLRTYLPKVMISVAIVSAVIIICRKKNESAKEQDPQDPTHIHAPVVLVVLLLCYIVLREIYHLWPDWAKPWKKLNKRHHGALGTDMKSLLAKLGNVLQAVEGRIEEHMSSEHLRQATVTTFKLTGQIKERAPKYRDALFERSGRPVKIPDDVIDHFKFADWAYDETASDQRWETVEDALESCGYDMIRHRKTAAPGCVCSYIAVNFSKKIALVTIKGTSSLGDALTDVCALAVKYTLPNAPIVEGMDTSFFVHEGMMFAAEQLGNEIKPLVQNWFLPQGFKLLIVGHSLGAGTACLLGIWLRSWFPETRGTDRLQVHAYATPAVADKATSLACTDFITTCVHNSDIVPRASLGNIFTGLHVHQKLLARLDETRQCPGREFGSTARWVQMIHFQKDFVVNPADLLLWRTQALETEDHKEEEHLYVPGKVYLMYDAWDKEGDGKKQQPTPTPPIDRVVECDGTCDALRIIDYDMARMLADHTDYYNPLRAAKELPAPVGYDSV